MARFGPGTAAFQRVGLCVRLPGIPQVFLGLGTKTPSLQVGWGFTPAGGWSCQPALHPPRKFAHRLQSFRQIPPQTLFPRSSRRALPPLAPNKHVAGDNLEKARDPRGGRAAPPPLRSPSVSAGAWRCKTRSGARLGEPGPRAEKAGASGPRVRASLKRGARPHRPRALFAPVKPQPQGFARCFRPVGTSPDCPKFIFFPSLMVC